MQTVVEATEPGRAREERLRALSNVPDGVRPPRSLVAELRGT